MMVDIEALGTSHNGLITQIGACYFDWDGNIAATFLVNINLKSAVARGMEMDIRAVCFWLEQAAQQGLPSWLKETVPLAKGLNDFYKFEKEAEAIWSHAFDKVLLGEAGLLCGIPKLVPHKKWRDIATLVNLSGRVKKDLVTVAKKTHNALEDCFYQVEYCTKCYRSLKGITYGRVDKSLKKVAYGRVK